MKRTIFIFVTLCLIIIPKSYFALDTFDNGPILTSDHKVSTKHGLGRIMTINSFELKNQKLTMEATAYLKGWSNVVVQSDYTYYDIENKKTFKGTYNPNTLYWFRLHGTNGEGDYNITIKKVSNYDYLHPVFDIIDSDGNKNGQIKYIDTYDLFRLFCPIKTGTGHGTACYYTSSNNTKHSILDVVGSGIEKTRNPHYRGGFRFENVNLTKLVPKSGKYTLQVNIQVRGHGGTKPCLTADGTPATYNSCYDWTDLDTCDENVCGRYQSLHGYISGEKYDAINSDSSNKNASDGTEIRLGENRQKLQSSKLIVNSAYPLSSGGTYCYPNTIPFSSGQSGFTIKNSGNNMFHVSNGNNYYGYEVKLPSGSMYCKGSSISTIRVPSSWFQVEGSLTFDIKKDGDIPTPKTYNDPESSCPKGYSQIEKTRVFLTSGVNEGDGVCNLDSMPENEILNKLGFHSTLNYVPFILRNIDDLKSNEEISSALKQNLLDSRTKILNRYHTLNDIKAVVSKINTITDKGAVYGWTDKVNNIVGSENTFTMTYNDPNKGEQNVRVYLYITTDSNSEIPSITTYMMNGTKESVSNMVNSLKFNDNTEVEKRIIGIEPYEGLNVIPGNQIPNNRFSVSSPLFYNSETGGSFNSSSKFVSFDINRRYQTKQIGDVIGDIRINGSKPLCDEKTGAVNSSAWRDNSNQYIQLLQLAIVDIDYCIKEELPPPGCEREWSPTKPVCSADKKVSGTFYETSKAHVCHKNFDDAKAVTAGDEGGNEGYASGFTIVDNEYCSVLCLDDIDVELPGFKGAYNGATFDLNVLSENGDKPNITMTRTCYSKINKDKYNEWANVYDNLGNDASEIQSQIDEIKACYNYKTNLFSDGKSPVITFKYDDKLFNEYLAGNKYKMSEADITPTDSIKIKVSKDENNSISEKDLVITDASKYKDVNNGEVRLSCNPNANSNECKLIDKVASPIFNLSDVTYIKKTETRKWEYSTPSFYSSLPTGSNIKIEDNPSGNYINFNNNSLPVSLTAAPGIYNYQLLISNFDDNVRKNHSNKLIDAMEEFNFFNTRETEFSEFNEITEDTELINDDTIGTGYTCNYRIFENITHEKHANFIYRNIDVSNPLNKASRNDRVGYNWTEAEENGIVDRIKNTSNYSVLTGVNDIDSEETTDIKRSDHFSFRLTPGIMKSIRDYNDLNGHDYSNFDLICEDDEPYYCESRFLTCLGSNNNGLNCGDISTSTRDPQLLNEARTKMRLKIQKYGNLQGGS